MILFNRGKGAQNPPQKQPRHCGCRGGCGGGGSSGDLGRGERERSPRGFASGSGLGCASGAGLGLGGSWRNPAKKIGSGSSKSLIAGGSGSPSPLVGFGFGFGKGRGRRGAVGTLALPAPLVGPSFEEEAAIGMVGPLTPPAPEEDEAPVAPPEGGTPTSNADKPAAAVPKRAVSGSLPVLMGSKN